MTHYTYERLSYEDNGFLRMETPTNPMHVAGVQIFAAGPLATADGGIDAASIRRLTESVLHRIPRYRQKLAWIPGQDHAVWVDDPNFNLDYHVRHTALPRPGTERQLKQLAARIMEQPLDRSRPVWETWVVEGLEGNRFAMITKIHHCMIDGSSGVDLSQILQSPEPTREIRKPPRFIPRPLPSPGELQREERSRRRWLPLQWLGNIADLARTTDDPLGEVGTRVRAVRDMLGWLADPPSETPLDGPTGPHRIFDWLVLPLDDVKSARRALGCTVNDVVLTTVTGAIREFLIHRQVRPEELEFRVAAPVNVRDDSDRGKMGNRVSTWVIPLPLEHSDPTKQLEAICEQTRRAKESHEELGTEMMLSLLDGLPFAPSPSLASRPVNTIVTNVPGPPFPLYLLGAEMLECFPLAPLLEDMGLAIGVLSYNGRMCFGFDADYDRMPDLSDFVQLMAESFERLSETGRARTSQTQERPGARKRRAAPRAPDTSPPPAETTRH
jgi:WS/DGAT/MGAT family acyltransferase